jgi:DNA-binding LytR/AlgR family response regulator
MPGISGIDFLRSLKNPPLVVFTTAYADYAVEGFELMAVDYLLKPITPGRFKQAVIRVQEKLSLPVLTIKEKPAELQPGSLSSNHIFVKVDSRLIRINFDDILFAEAQRDFTKVYFHEKSILISFHLKMLEEMLPQNKFIRIHRSYVINMSKVASIEGNRVFIHQQEIPVGSNYKEHFLKSMGI